MATGHYARVHFSSERKRYWIGRGRDGNKDQSYALWGLTQASLARTMFPLGELTKPEVRGLAKEFGLDAAKKGESFEICFIPDNNYERFLKDRVPGLGEQVQGGEITLDGQPVGTHRGYPFYTIGQRRGVGIATGEPVYVTAIDPVNNRVEVGSEQALFKNAMTVRSVNWMKYDSPAAPMPVDVRIRYKDPGGAARLVCLDGGRVSVQFAAPRRAITPGQSAVFYEGEDIVGGGIIDEGKNNGQ